MARATGEAEHAPVISPPVSSRMADPDATADFVESHLDAAPAPTPAPNARDVAAPNVAVPPPAPASPSSLPVESPAVEPTPATQRRRPTEPPGMHTEVVERITHTTHRVDHTVVEPPPPLAVDRRAADPSPPARAVEPAPATSPARHPQLRAGPPPVQPPVPPPPARPVATGNTDAPLERRPLSPRPASRTEAPPAPMLAPPAPRDRAEPVVAAPPTSPGPALVIGTLRVDVVPPAPAQQSATPIRTEPARNSEGRGRAIKPPFGLGQV